MWWRWEVKVFGEGGCSLVPYLLCSERATNMQEVASSRLRRATKAQRISDYTLHNSAEFFRPNQNTQPLTWHQNQPILSLNSSPIQHQKFIMKVILQSHQASWSISIKMYPTIKCTHISTQAKIHILKNSLINMCHFMTNNAKGPHITFPNSATTNQHHKA